MTTRVNGTYHAVGAARRSQRQTRVLIGVGVMLALLALINIVLINNEMASLEKAGPERLALAGGGVDRFVPSLLLNLPRATQPLQSGGGITAGDPRHTPVYVDAKRALERWVALLGFAMSALFVGLEGTIPEGSTARSSTLGTDLARLLVLLSLTYAALSLFESG